MRNHFKRLFALILVMVLMFSVVPATLAVGSGSGRTDRPLLDNASEILDADVFAKIAAVEEKAARPMGGKSQMTEADYISIVPAVKKAIEGSETYLPGTLKANGNFLVWETTTGMPCCYDPRMEAELHNTFNDPSPAEMMNIEAEAQKLAVNLGSAAELNGGTPSSVKIGLIQPYWESSTSYADSSFKNYSPAYKTMWQNLYAAIGGSGMRYSMKNATVDNVAKTIQECALVIFDSHGTTDYSNNGDYTSRANSSYLCLTTSAGITAADVKAKSGKFGTYYDCLKGSGYAYVNGQCIANHMTKKAPHSLVYMGICLGMATDRMFAPLRSKGVEVVYGYSQSVSFSGEKQYMESILGYVKSGYSFGQAVSKTKSALGNWDPAYKNYTLAQAKTYRVAFPIVVSSEDAYPGQGKVDVVQTVKSKWIVTLPLLMQGGSQNTALRVRTLQRMLIAKGYSCGSCGADGDFGSGTRAAVVKLQKAKGLAQDGIVGPNTWTALLKLCQIQKGAKGDLVKLLQQILISQGYSCGSCGADGDFGDGTRTAVINFQRAKGLNADGIVGKDTWTRLLMAYFY